MVVKRNMAAKAKVFEYITANADRILDLSEISGATGALRGSVSAALQRIATDYPQLEFMSRGAYRWNSNSGSTERVEELVVGDVRRVTVLAKKDDGSMLVATDTKEMFKMVPFKF